VNRPLLAASGAMGCSPNVPPLFALWPTDKCAKTGYSDPHGGAGVRRMEVPPPRLDPHIPRLRVFGQGVVWTAG
jgi:hypothetical protein